MQHLHVRLALAIFAVAGAVFLSLVVALNLVFVLGFDQRYTASLSEVESLLRSPEWDAAVADLPAAVGAPLADFEARFTQFAQFVRQVRGNRWWIVIAFFAVLAPVVLALAWNVSRRLTRPLNAVADASRRIARGDLSVRIEAQARSWDRQSRGLADDFNAMAASLERLEGERQEMIADIAHELRTPLTAMQLQLEAAADGIEPLTRDLIERLSTEAGVLARLVIDLRVLSLAEARHLSLDLEPVDLCDLLASVRVGFEAAAARKGIALRVAACTPIVVRADVERLRQAVGNFVNNAIRHTPDGGEVTLGLAASDERATIEVVDTGPGLSQAALARAFDRFYRSDNGRVRAEGGSGLGLAIAKALAELHGGTVAAENRAEGGARFTLTLPRAGGRGLAADTGPTTLSRSPLG